MNTIKDFVEFSKLTITSQGVKLAELMRKDVVSTGTKQKIWYSFNKDIKLWDIQNDDEFYSYLNNYLNIFITRINELLENLDCECDKNKQLLKELAKQTGQKIDIKKNSDCSCDVSILKKLSKSFDNSKYIDDIRKRFYGSMVDKNIEEKLNIKPDILSLKDGKKINLKTLEISDKTQDDYCTFGCDVEYVEETPNANRFFQDIMPDETNREFLRKVLGYMISGDTKARKFQTWYGHGSNGKSVLLSLLKKIMNTYYCTADKNVFCKSTFSNASGASPHLYSLLGKRIIAYSEGETSDNFELDFSVLKNISGEDPIRCRALYKDQIEFLSQGKLVLASNYVPPLTSEQAIKDRSIIIFFDSRFTDKPTKDEILKDCDFVDKLHNEYLNEVFSWIVKGSKIYYQDRKIEMTKEFKERTETLVNGEDSIQTFFNNKCEFTGNKKDYVRKKPLFEIYKQYANDNAQRCQPHSTLYTRLLSIKGIEQKTLDGYDVYRGIKLVDKKQTEDNDLDSGITEDIITDKDEIIKQKDKVIENLMNEIQLLKQKLNEMNQPKKEEPKEEQEYIILPKKTKKVNVKKQQVEDDVVDDFIKEIEKDDFILDLQ
jgi:P4 family phage/plasmid primase-like protien